jgi:hypothetical protein
MHKLHRGLVALFSIIMGCWVLSALAIDGDQTYLVVYAKFKPGKAPEAIKIIHEHFWPVDRKIGRQAIPFADAQLPRSNRWTLDAWCTGG